MKKTNKTPQPAVAPTKQGMLEQVGEELKEDLKTTPQAVTDAIVQDAKQAVNYEIRKGLRGLINGFFSRKR
jgi:hypothetical protein